MDILEKLLDCTFMRTNISNEEGYKGKSHFLKLQNDNVNGTIEIPLNMAVNCIDGTNPDIMYIKPIVEEYSLEEYVTPGSTLNRFNRHNYMIGIFSRGRRSKLIMKGCGPMIFDENNKLLFLITKVIWLGTLDVIKYNLYIDKSVFTNENKAIRSLGNVYKKAQKKIEDDDKNDNIYSFTKKMDLHLVRNLNNKFVLSTFHGTETINNEDLNTFFNDNIDSFVDRLII